MRLVRNVSKNYSGEKKWTTAGFYAVGDPLNAFMSSMIEKEKYS